MRAPRRSPYEHYTSLHQLYSHLYPADHHTNIDNEDYRRQRTQGLAIVHLWLNRTACPFAVESTASLIQAQSLDEQLLLLSLLPSSRSDSEWIVRSTYAMAILRFVNSVADTFQTSLYAQSIFQISQRIGLPIWLVELRHAATHEELPSLEVLRDACIASLHWLQAHFWHPTLARRRLPGSGESAAASTIRRTSSAYLDNMQGIQNDATAQLRLHLASYRKLAKGVVRDQSLRGRYKTALMVAQNKVESCAKKAEAALASVVLNGDKDQADDGWNVEQEEVATASVLLVDALLEAGGIVPLSKL
jgi:ribosomal biogenesis protein LAS1